MAFSESAKLKEPDGHPTNTTRSGELRGDSGEGSWGGDQGTGGEGWPHQAAAEDPEHDGPGHLYEAPLTVTPQNGS